MRLAPLAALAWLVLLPLTAVTAPTASTGAATATPPAAPAADDRPNIVLVQLDDVSRDLMGTMASVRRMRAEGASFTRASVVDSLCCPSRASLFTGRAPHHTTVRTNTAGPRPGRPTGGWAAYVRAGNPAITFHRELERSGYTTGFVGKFLNEFTPGVTRPVPGWSEFEPVYGSGYRGWGYKVGRIGADGAMAVRTVARPPASASRAVKDAAYVQTFVEERALSFIDRHADEAAPYFYALSPYAAHARVGGRAYRGDPRFPAAFADRPRPGSPQGDCGLVACGSLDVRRLPGYDDPRGDNRPVRLVGGRALPAAHWRPQRGRQPVAALNRQLRDRARMLQSVDRTLMRVLDAVDDDTYVVLTSDNGFHLGQARLDAGKGTPYRTDSRVPLLVVGPGVEPGTRSGAVSNLDLAPTFEELGGLDGPGRPSRDGTSFAAQLADAGTRETRRFVFMEHTRDLRPGDPDPDADDAPSFVAVDGPRGLLVRFDLAPAPGRTRYGWELYTYRSAPYERTNELRALHRRAWVRDLVRRVRAWDDCAPARCRALTR